MADLTPWAGREVSLRFTARPLLKASSGAHPQPLVPVWGEPVIASVHAQRVAQAVDSFNDWNRNVSGTTSAGDTKFSHDRGFYENPIEVTIATSTPGATIVYTTDGGEPSPSNGIVGDKVLVDRTTVLRAMAYKDGARSTNVDTHTYIFPKTVEAQTTFPSTTRPFGMAPRRDLDLGIDPDVVNTSNQRGEFVEGLTSIPTLSIVMDGDYLFNETQGLYFDKGALTRPASVELLYPSKFSDFEGFQVDCEVRIHGHRAIYPFREKRSFRLIFKKDVGPGMLRYPFFESAVHHAESAVKEFNTIVLRTGGQENWSRGDVSELAVYVRDQHARDVQLSLSGTAARGIFVHLYLNGIYWGVYNAVERPDQRFLASYYGGDSATDWFAINHNQVLGTPNPRWYAMHRYARDNDLSDSAKYQEMKILLDTDQFSDYILLNWFAGRGDWGHNNWYGGIRIRPPGAGAYFLWDSEITYGLLANSAFDSNAGAWVPPKFVSGGTTRLHQLWMALVDSPEFRLEFTDRVYRACYNGGPLADSVNKTNFRRLADYVEPAMLCESARWGDASPRQKESSPHAGCALEAFAGLCSSFDGRQRRKVHSSATRP